MRACVRSGAWGPGWVGRAVGFGRGRCGQRVGVAAQALLAAGPDKTPIGTPLELLVLRLCGPEAVCTVEAGGHQSGKVSSAQPSPAHADLQGGGHLFPSAHRSWIMGYLN